MGTLHLQIVTAGGSVCNENASYVSVPLTDGEAGILPGHAAMIAALKEGVVKYTVEDEKRYAAVSGGVLSITDNELIILARTAEKAEDIDTARAKEAERRARERLAAKGENIDLTRAEAGLRRATSRLKATELNNKA